MSGSQAPQHSPGRRQEPGPPWPPARSPSVCPSTPRSCQAASASCLGALPAYPQTHNMALQQQSEERGLIPVRSHLGWKHLPVAKSRGAAPLPIALGCHSLQPRPLLLLPSGWSSEAPNITQGQESLALASAIWSGLSLVPCTARSGFQPSATAGGELHVRQGLQPFPRDPGD